MTSKKKTKTNVFVSKKTTKNIETVEKSRKFPLAWPRCGIRPTSEWWEWWKVGSFENEENEENEEIVFRFVSKSSYENKTKQRDVLFFEILRFFYVFHAFFCLKKETKQLRPPFCFSKTRNKQKNLKDLTNTKII